MYQNCRRRYPRKSFAIPVEYSVSRLEFRELKKVHKSGMTTDISDKGLGLITDFPLEPGHVLILNSNDNSHPFPKIAIVRWTIPITNSYRVGLEFV